jgi:hypothetical protein
MRAIAQYGVLSLGPAARPCARQPPTNTRQLLAAPAWQKSDELTHASNVMCVVGKSCRAAAGTAGTAGRHMQPQARSASGLTRMQATLHLLPVPALHAARCHTALLAIAVWLSHRVCAHARVVLDTSRRVQQRNSSCAIAPHARTLKSVFSSTWSLNCSACPAPPGAETVPAPGWQQRTHARTHATQQHLPSVRTTDNSTAGASPVAHQHMATACNSTLAGMARSVSTPSAHTLQPGSLASMHAVGTSTPLACAPSGLPV